MMIVQLVIASRGVAALPNWAIAEFEDGALLVSRALGACGLWSTLYAAFRVEHREHAFVRDFVRSARETCFAQLNGIQPATGPRRAASIALPVFDTHSILLSVLRVHTRSGVRQPPCCLPTVARQRKTRAFADGGSLMSDRKNRPMDPESILSTLDHISQAIDAMTAVVGELREYLDENFELVEVSRITLEPEELELAESESGVRTVH